MSWGYVCVLVSLTFQTTLNMMNGNFFDYDILRNTSMHIWIFGVNWDGYTSIVNFHLLYANYFCLFTYFTYKTHGNVRISVCVTVRIFFVDNLRIKHMKTYIFSHYNIITRTKRVYCDVLVLCFDKRNVNQSTQETNFPHKVLKTQTDIITTSFPFVWECFLPRMVWFQCD